MASFLDNYDIAQDPAAAAPPPAPAAPKSFLDAYPEAPAAGVPRAAEGFGESIKAGFQGSATGLAWRGKLPELVMDPAHAKWWERAAAGIAQVGSELPLMAVGGAAGAPAGAAVGGAITGPAAPAGAIVGGILGTGAGMFAVPAAIRESLMQAYKSGEVKTAADWWNIVREVAQTTVKEGAIGAATFGAGGIAARTVGKAIAPMIGDTMTVGTGIKAIGATDTAAQIAAMVTMPAVLQGRLPDAQEFLDAAIVIGGVKAAHPIAARITNIFTRTGKTPAEQVADAKADPPIAKDIIEGPEREVDPLRGQLSKQEELWSLQDRLNGLEARANNGVGAQFEGTYSDGGKYSISYETEQRTDGSHALVRTMSDDQGSRTEHLTKDGTWEKGRPARTSAMGAHAEETGPETFPTQDHAMQMGREEATQMGATKAARPSLLTHGERQEYESLKAKAAALKAEGVEPVKPAPTPTPPGAYSEDQLAEATGMAKTRLEALNAKTATGALSDAERAERVLLTNAMGNPEALAKRFGLEPTRAAPTPDEHDASAQRIYDQFYAEAKAADDARMAVGQEPLGDDHARAVALLVRHNAETIAKSEGILPEDVYRDRQPHLVNESAMKIAAAEAAVPEGAPRFVPPELKAPEVDLFGDPIVDPVDALTTPRHAVGPIESRMVPVADLTLSKDVPQFKHAANEKGIVEPLGGVWDPTGVGPIQVWERENGAMEVISGRHRLDKVQRDGIPEILAQVHREADGFTRDMAATLDAQLNIRDNQGSVADYAQYFKTANISKEAADAAGLLARGKGRTGFAIARDASADVLAAHRAGLLSDDAALAISATAPGSERLQGLGIAMVNEGKSILFATNMMRAVDLMAAEAMGRGEQGDLWNLDDSGLREAAAMSKKASSMQRKIGERLSAISGASRRPELARAEGIDVTNPEAIQKRIVELKQEQYQWDNWPLYPELVAKLRGQELHQDERQKYEQTADGPVLRTPQLAISDPYFDRTERGVDVHRHDLRDASGTKIGEATIGWKGDQVADLINVFAEPQGAGTGEKLIRAILIHNKPETVLNILYIQPEARAFWEKMGTVITNDGEYDNGTITRESYEAARASRGVRDDLRAGEGTTGLPSEPTGQDIGGKKGPGGGAGGGTLFQDAEPFELRAETPAEARARDEEAAAAAKRKLEQERAGVKGPVLTGDQADLFNTQRTLFQSKEDKPWYYSELARSIESSPMKQGTAKSWQDYIKSRIGKGVKGEEIEATGINDWLATQEGRVTKEQVSAFMEQGGVKVTETVLGGNIKPSKEMQNWLMRTREELPATSQQWQDIADIIETRANRTGGEERRELHTLAEEAQRRAEGLDETGSTSASTKFEDYQLPGSVPGSYRELVLTLPKVAPTTLPDGYQVVPNPITASIAKKFTVVTNDGVRYASGDTEAEAIANFHKFHGSVLGTTTPTFKSSHFPEAGNYLAHLRVNDRTVPLENLTETFPDLAARLKAEGKTEAKVLHAEEFQSDRAQKGRVEGFAGPRVTDTTGWTGDIVGEGPAAFYRVKDAAGEWIANIPADSPEAAISEAARRLGTKPGIAPAPFVTKTEAWTSLLVKRMIRYGSEGDYDLISWSTGEQQVERYNSALRKAVDVIEWKKTPEGVQIVGYKGGPKGLTTERLAQINARLDEMRELGSNWSQTLEREETALKKERGDFGDARTKVVDTTEKESALSDAIGKSMADKIRNDPNQSGTIEGDGITVSDTGMSGYYDRMLPKIVNRVLKDLKVEGKVGEVTINQPRGIERQQYIGPQVLNTEMMQMVRAAGAPVAIEQQVNGVRVALEQGKTFQEAMAQYGSQTLAEIIGGRMDQTSEIGTKQPAFELTPALKEKARGGLPLFQDKPQDRDNEHLASYNVAERLITTLAGANKSSVIHELGHHFLENLKYYAERPGASDKIKADWEIARREFAIGEAVDISTASHEQMARTWERYLADGEAPSVGLRGVFEQFKTWMLEVYKTVANLPGIQINPQIRLLFDHMLATDEEIAAAKDMNVPRAYVPEAKAAAAERIVPPQEPGKKMDPGFKDEQLAIEPFAEELLPGPGSGLTNDSRVNAQYINGPMDLKLAIQQIANRDQANIQQHRGGPGGVKGWEQANAEADKLAEEVMGGKMADSALDRSPNAPPHDIQQRAAFKIMMAVAKYSLKLRDEILAKGDNASVQDQFDYLNSILRMRMAHAEFLGLRAAAARAMNQIRDMTPESGAIDKMVELTSGRDQTLFQDAKTPAEQAAEIKAKLDEIMRVHFSGKGALDIARLQKDVKSLKGQLALAKAVTDATKWEMVVEGWKMGMLSGPQTPVVNVIGTWSFMALRAPIDAVASMIGMARGASPGMGETDRASMSEALARITGPLRGLQAGLKLAYHSFSEEPVSGKTESYRAAIPGRAAEIYRKATFGVMSAGDILTTTTYKRGELETLAIRTAFDEDLNPGTREFSDRVQHLIDNPTPSIEAEANKAATRMAFNDPGGEKMRSVQSFVRNWGLQWIAPFIRTPGNVAEEMVRLTPFAPLLPSWRADFAKGGVARDKAIAEVLVGSGIMALTMAYAFDGQITGSGDPDPGKNRGKVGVWQANSILVGDRYYEIGRLQPGGTLMVLAADVANAWDHMNEEEKDKVPKILAMAFANAITNQTMLQGLTNIVHLMSEPDRYGARFFQSLAGSTVPNIIGQTSSMSDPYVREVSSMLEAIQSRTPWRQDLMAKRDWLGEPIKTSERMGLVLPVREQQVSEDKVRLEAARLDISMAAAPKKTHIGKGTGKLGDVELTPEEKNKFQEVGGQFAHNILTNIVNAEGYDSIPDLVKRRIFAKVLTASHKLAAVQALPMDKRIAYIQSISEKVQAELAPDAAE